MFLVVSVQTIHHVLDERCGTGRGHMCLTHVLRQLLVAAFCRPGPLVGDVLTAFQLELTRGTQVRV